MLTEQRREYHKEYLKVWRKENIENIRTWRKHYSKENVEMYRESRRKWKKTNPERVKIHSRVANHNRRARLNNVDGTHSPQDEMDLFVWQRGVCHYCGDFLYSNMPYHIEHKIPLSRGGTNYIENIALSCPDCNRHKHNKTESEFFGIHTKELNGVRRS
jgi:5-methylcytosine-specific restriction endonuclease McrA